MRHKIDGSILTEILAITVVIFLLLIIALPALNRERVITQNKTIQDNLRLIANTARRYFDRVGVTEVYQADMVGSNQTLLVLPKPVAGEDYTSLFPISVGFTELTVIRANGEAVSYKVQR